LLIAVLFEDHLAKEVQQEDSEDNSVDEKNQSSLFAAEIDSRDNVSLPCCCVSLSDDWEVLDIYWRCVMDETR